MHPQNPNQPPFPNPSLHPPTPQQRPVATHGTIIVTSAGFQSIMEVDDDDGVGNDNDDDDDDDDDDDEMR